MDKAELKDFKAKVMTELKDSGVRIYQFPLDDETEVNLMNGHLPFAVVGSSDFVKVGSTMTRARHYPWGVVEIMNDDHCDTNRLRKALMGIVDLTESTHRSNYEMFRRERLRQMGLCDGAGSFLERCKLLRETHLKSLEQKEEELKQKFLVRVKENASKLDEAKREMRERADDMEQKEAEAKKRLEDECRRLEEDIDEFQRRKAQYEAEKMNSSGRLTLRKLGKNK